MRLRSAKSSEGEQEHIAQKQKIPDASYHRI
jgi:hypothetical protein